MPEDASLTTEEQLETCAIITRLIRQRVPFIEEGIEPLDIPTQWVDVRRPEPFSDLEANYCIVAPPPSERIADLLPDVVTTVLETGRLLFIIARPFKPTRYLPILKQYLDSLEADSVGLEARVQDVFALTVKCAMDTARRDRMRNQGENPEGDGSSPAPPR